MVHRGMLRRSAGIPWGRIISYIGRNQPDLNGIPLPVLGTIQLYEEHGLTGAQYQSSARDGNTEGWPENRERQMRPYPYLTRFA